MQPWPTACRKDVVTSIRRLSGFAPLVVFAIAVGTFGALFEGYSHAHHPVSLLGGKGIAHALPFNLAAFAVPGLIGAWLAWRLRSRLPPDTTWPARIGASLALLSAPAFVAQGVLPLDPADLDAPASRLHYLAWMLWWIAFVPAGLLLAAGLRRAQGWRVFAMVSVASAVVVAACALLPAVVLSAGVLQRIGFVTWLLWFCVQPKLDHLVVIPAKAGIQRH